MIYRQNLKRRRMIGNHVSKITVNYNQSAIRETQNCKCSYEMPRTLNLVVRAGDLRGRPTDYNAMIPGPLANM